MINILYLNYSNQMGGAEKSLLDMFSNINKNAFKLHLIVFGYGKLSDKALNTGIDIIHLPEISSLKKIKRNLLLIDILKNISTLFLLLKQIYLIRKVIKNRNIHIIHTNNPKSHIIGCLSSICSNTKLIFHMRDIFRKHSFAHIVFNISGNIKKTTTICISNAVHKNLPCSLKKNSTLIYNGFNMPVIKKDRKRIRKNLCLNNNDKVIITASRIVPWKGHDILISSINDLLKNSECKLIIAGEPTYGNNDYLSNLKEYIRNKNIANNIIFIGYIEDIYSTISACDIFVMPSKNEPFGRGLVEAMLCQIPVIAFNEGGPKEIINDGKDGLLIEPYNKKKLNHAIKYLLNDHEKRIEMGLKAKKNAIKCFSINTSINKLENLYLSILN